MCLVAETWNETWSLIVIAISRLTLGFAQCIRFNRSLIVLLLGCLHVFLGNFLFISASLATVLESRLITRIMSLASRLLHFWFRWNCFVTKKCVASLLSFLQVCLTNCTWVVKQLFLVNNWLTHVNQKWIKFFKNHVASQHLWRNTFYVEA